MSDTSPEFEAMVNERYRRMTPDERVGLGSGSNIERTDLVHRGSPIPGPPADVPR